MTILQSLERLFNGEIEEMTFEDILSIPPNPSSGQLSLSYQVEEDGVTITIGFIKRDGRWIVTSYQKEAS